MQNYVSDILSNSHGKTQYLLFVLIKHLFNNLLYRELLSHIIYIYNVSSVIITIEFFIVIKYMTILVENEFLQLFAIYKVHNWVSFWYAYNGCVVMTWMRIYMAQTYKSKYLSLLMWEMKKRQKLLNKTNRLYFILKIEAILRKHI